MMDTFYGDLADKFLSTILGFMIIDGALLGVSFVLYLFFELWSNLL